MLGAGRKGVKARGLVFRAKDTSSGSEASTMVKCAVFVRI